MIFLIFFLVFHPHPLIKLLWFSYVGLDYPLVQKCQVPCALFVHPNSIFLFENRILESLSPFPLSIESVSC